MSRYACPCCKYYSFVDYDDAFFEICSICFWQNDTNELDKCSGANHGLTLRQAQINFLKFGACDERFIGSTRKPREYELHK